MVASAYGFLTTLLSILLLSSASVQSGDARGIVSPPAVEEQLQSLYQININDSPVRLHQTGQCPTSPKPGCSDPDCQGPSYVGPMQFQCEATTAFHMNGREVILTGCRCCPLPHVLQCLNHDCRAPTGTRQCTSEELGGCACETDDDRAERFRREFRVEDIPVFAEGELEEDLIEINDDGLSDSESMAQTRAVTARPNVSPSLSQTLQEQERQRTGVMALPTLGFDQQQFRVTRDAQVDVLASF